MCTGDTPTYGSGSPSKPDANGTWTPVEAWTDEERRANYDRILAENKAYMAANNGSMAGPNQKIHGGNTGPFAAEMAAAEANAKQNTMRTRQAAADAAHLASLPRQAATQARAPGRTGANPAVGGGGPSTLLTGGTASDALVGKKPVIGKTSLLSG